MIYIKMENIKLNIILWKCKPWPPKKIKTQLGQFYILNIQERNINSGYIPTDKLDRQSFYDLFPLKNIAKYIFKICRNENLSSTLFEPCQTENAE